MRVRAAIVFLAFVVVPLAGCRRAPPQPVIAAPVADGSDAIAIVDAATAIVDAGSPAADAYDVADGAAPLAPLSSAEVARPLVVPGHGDAIVVLPLGTTRPRPIVVALHGLWDRPDWQCGAWNAVLHGRAFVLCPRGIPSTQATSDDPRLTYTHAEAMAIEVDDAIAALRAAYPAYVDPGPIVYVGFSLGAIYGVPTVAAAPARFPRVILVEGGHEAWTPQRARAFAKRGGERILFLCGSDDCPIAAGRAIRRLAAAGVTDVRIHTLKGAGHTYGGSLFDASRADIEWALGDDPRFAD